MKNVNIVRKLYNKAAKALGKIDDFFYIGGGAMCDMAWVVEGPITGDHSKDGYIHHVNGQWVFNREMFDGHFRRYANEGMRLHRTALCVGGKKPRKELFMPWGFVPSMDAFNLSIFVEDWFIIFETMVDRWNHWGIAPVICLKNECDKRKPERIAQSPYYHNVNGGKSLYDAVAIKHDQIFVDKLLSRLKGKDFWVELINEGHDRRDGAVEWARAIIPVLYKHDIQPWRISLGADVVDYIFTGIGKPGDRLKYRWKEFDGLENYDLIMHGLVKEYEKEKKYTNATHQAFYVCHSFGEQPHEDFPEQTPYGTRTQFTVEAWSMHNCFSNRVFYSTDGTDFADTPGGRPSPKRMKAAILYVLRSNPAYKKLPYVSGGAFKYIFDYLPQRQKVDDVVLAIRAMAEAHHEFFGTWPKNRGQYPPVEPEPPAKPKIILKATRSSIVKGESVVLVWVAKNADQVKMGSVKLALAGKATVMPGQTTTFSATATGPGGSATAAVTIEVTEPEPPASEPEPEPEPSAPAPTEPWWSWKRLRNVRRWTWQGWLALAAVLAALYTLAKMIF